MKKESTVHKDRLSIDRARTFARVPVPIFFFSRTHWRTPRRRYDARAGYISLFPLTACFGCILLASRTPTRMPGTDPSLPILKSRAHVLTTTTRYTLSYICAPPRSYLYIYIYPEPGRKYRKVRGGDVRPGGKDAEESELRRKPNAMTSLKPAGARTTHTPRGYIPRRRRRRAHRVSTRSGGTGRRVVRAYPRRDAYNASSPRARGGNGGGDPCDSVLGEIRSSPRAFTICPAGRSVDKEVAAYSFLFSMNYDAKYRADIISRLYVSCTLLARMFRYA